MNFGVIHKVPSKENKGVTEQLGSTSSPPTAKVFLSRPPLVVSLLLVCLYLKVLQVKYV